MREECLAEIEGQNIVALFTVTRVMKLRQIASGFVYTGDDAAIEFYTSKYEAMLEIIEELGDERVIVFAHFTQTLNYLHQYLVNRKYKVARFIDPMKDHALRQFESGEARLLIANPMSAGHGLNLQYCSNIIYLEHDYNLETYDQSVQRIERIGQENKMTVYHIITKGPIERHILNALNKKIDLNKNIRVDDVRRML